MALDPEDARNIPAHLIALYTDAELALLRLLAEAIADGIDTDDWQQVQASRQAEFRQAAEALARHLQAAMPPLLQAAVQAATDLGEQAADEDADTPEPPEAVSVAATGTAATVAGSAPRRDRPRNPRTVAATQSAWSTLARTTQLLPANADRLYGQVLAQIQVRSPDIPRTTPHTGGILGAPRATGTRLDAAQQALDILTKRGITGFRDRGGRNWSLTSYVEMLSRSVVNEELREAHIARALEHGHTLMVVSSHSKPAPQCQPYEGQVLSLDGSTGTVELESAATGRPVRVTIKATMLEAISNGFRHPNCGHALSRFVPGASRTFTTKPDPEGYAATQQQRAMERAIRDTRTRQAVAITPQAKRDTAARLRAQQAAIRAHVDEHGLTRRPRREQINRAR
ncbi:phage minor capsid protein [Rhodococcus zopfii]|uniref:phage minor capsid protein n=1 Tax=Rhodococcus zopfii TaxID=43772 RepID=UPI003663CC3A